MGHGRFSEGQNGHCSYRQEATILSMCQKGRTKRDGSAARNVGRRPRPGRVGWRAYRIDDPEDGDTPEIGFFCPDCADREFGPLADRNDWGDSTHP